MNPEKHFDIRLIKRNLDKGVITQQEYDAYLAGLKDITAKAQLVSSPQPIVKVPEND